MSLGTGTGTGGAARLRQVWRAAWQRWLTPAALVRQGHTVRAKLLGVVIMTVAIALLVASAAMLTYDIGSYRHSWAATIRTQGGTLALSAAPALAFQDHDAALRGLTALQADPAVIVAALYSANGRLYAAYVRPGTSPPPLQLQATNRIVTRIRGSDVELIQPVFQPGEWLGTLYLRSRHDVFARVATYLGIFALVMAMSMGVAVVLSARLRRIITVPLDAMAYVARQIVHRRDYSLRARKVSDDEIGLVVDAFNRMLDEMQARTLALEQSNSALQTEVATRLAAEMALERATARLDSTMAAGEIGTWFWDLRSGDFVADRNLAALYGLQDAAALSGDPQLHRQAIHPLDQAVAIAVETAASRGRPLESVEYRIIQPDGTARWVAARGRVHCDAGGQPVLIAGLLIDISAQKRAEAALREADRRKDEFLATLAHELRNPLAPIRHAARLLEATEVEDRQRHWARAVIARQVQRMALLLDDLLDVSRITSGRLELRREPTQLRAVVAAAVETARPLISARNHTLQIHLPADPAGPIELLVDPLRISQALSNLLTNAAKYTDPGGRIGLDAWLQPDGLRIRVTDNGIGLAPQTIPRVFEMFSQIDTAIDRAEGGLGIGLALVRGLMQLHGGTVEASSPGAGCGSTFTLWLPPATVTRQRVGIDAPPPAVAGPQPGCKVVVADDNRDAADTLAMVLRMTGHEVRVAYSGARALELGASESPDAFILDIGMPDLNGYEVARRIRAQPWGRQALLLALTGWGQQDDKDQARAAGFDHHLTKPVDPDQAVALLRACPHCREAGDAAEAGG